VKSGWGFTFRKRSLVTISVCFGLQVWYSITWNSPLLILTLANHQPHGSISFALVWTWIEKRYKKFSKQPTSQRFLKLFGCISSMIFGSTFVTLGNNAIGRRGQQNKTYLVWAHCLNNSCGQSAPVTTQQTWRIRFIKLCAQQLCHLIATSVQSRSLDDTRGPKLKASHCKPVSSGHPCGLPGKH